MKYLSDLMRLLLPIGMMRLGITDEEQALLDEIAFGDEQTGNANDVRLKKLNAIGLKADEERADELQDVHDDDTTSKFVPGQIDENGDPVVDEAAAAEAAAAAEEAAAAAARADAEAAAAAESATAPKRKLKINGIEKEFTEEELVELAQKGAAADDKFQEAARLRAEAENLAARGTTREDVPADDSAELLALARALQVGTDEEAVAALRKLKAPPPSMRLDEVDRRVDAKIAFNDAIRTFETEFADLVKDPRLDRMIMDRDSELVKAGDKRPFLVRYREIGNEVRAWKQSLAGPAPAPAPADPMLARADRKAAAPAAPPSAGGKAPPTQSEEEPEESVQQVIANMSKARGGPQWARS
jgi:hypothetical protein